ncbi:MULTISPECIES: formate--tetrahydrofolate ligase [unclassified Arthrobacter]|uniref:formate--tetrahydrofolate ligase n=1 Tax=unclassified Arthrobacter TaxID=235627 RepID=UPI001E6584A4|nr:MULTISPECIES: formate--tetrahydrofolate ligase [unclassified Arthrobacter]MCC9144293.1 formate--tetrahydrofolate ligase [Arthrobacter sp. zg-Y919]MDK1275519.1 formate--tetrahydrofolate ligase [Arthrobacter sp. zg.Y919]WIB03106.1 formate--tetrahydrofolate ligase [Arthrobacter sp. zg-Y919]
MPTSADVPSDLEISRAARLLPITEIARRVAIPDGALEPYGRYKAKVDPALLPEGTARGRVVLVTAMSPTPAGEGKSTVTVGLADALQRAGETVMIALREPSMGPVLGMKGGATGGGYSQVVPMEDINLHFTGDFHAITAANNALAALVDNHIYQGNQLGLDPRRVTFKRVLDMNDRALRDIVIGLGGPAQGVPRQDGFDITVASEVMAIFCLARDLADLSERLSRITVGYTYDRRPVTVADLGAEGAMTLLLRDALKPNLVQTLAGTPALVHGGPFANIAHGCNSVIATATARRLAGIVVTEAGFGADLGAEKYLDIKSRVADVAPDAVVVVATVRALKMHGGVPRDDLTAENIPALRAGAANLQRHLANIRRFGINPVVAVNRFRTDTDAELRWLLDWCAEQGVSAALADVWAQGGGGPGGDDLAAAVLRALDQPADFRFLYPDGMPVEEKIRTVAREIYGAADVEFAAPARRRLQEIHARNLEHLPVCMAKTPYSFSDDPAVLGAPSGFTLHVRDLTLKTGAGFVVALTGAVMTMPGLPRNPAALRMGVSADGTPSGLI